MRRLLNLGSCCASLWITTKKVSSTSQYPSMALGCVVDFRHTSEPASASTVRLELLLTSSLSATSADSARCRRRSRYWKPSLCGRPSTPAPVRRTSIATKVAWRLRVLFICGVAPRGMAFATQPSWGMGTYQPSTPSVDFWRLTSPVDFTLLCTHGEGGMPQSHLQAPWNAPQEVDGWVEGGRHDKSRQAHQEISSCRKGWAD